MRGSKVSLGLAAVTCGVVGWCSVGAVHAAPSDVYCGTDLLGNVDFANYGPKYSYYDPNKDNGVGNPPGGRVTHSPPRRTPPLQLLDDSGGANFDSTFNFTGCPNGKTLRPGETFQWLQVVTTNAPNSNSVRGTAPTTGYIDPWSPTSGPETGVSGTGYEDLKPFYWTDSELANPNIGGNPSATNKLTFFDTSQRAFTAANDNDVNWSADLYLVCTWDNKIKVLGYYTWGWTMPKGMAGDFSKAIMVNPANPVFTPGAKGNLAGLLASEFGPGVPLSPLAGWTLTTEACCIPEPSLASLPILGFALLAVRRSRRVAA